MNRLDGKNVIAGQLKGATITGKSQRSTRSGLYIDVPMPGDIARKEPSAMRILLQEKETGLYFMGVGHWTSEPKEAMDFLSSTKAIDFCVANKISGVQLVLKFEEQLHDIVLPMVTDRRYHSNRPGLGA